MTDRERTPLPAGLLRLLYGGLAAAIVGNVAIVAFMISRHVYAFAGNLAAIVVCVAAAFIVRWRARGML